LFSLFSPQEGRTPYNDRLRRNRIRRSKLLTTSWERREHMSDEEEPAANESGCFRHRLSSLPIRLRLKSRIIKDGGGTPGAAFSLLHYVCNFVAQQLLSQHTSGIILINSSRSSPAKASTRWT